MFLQLTKFTLEQRPLFQAIVRKCILFIWCLPSNTAMPYTNILIISWSKCSFHNNSKTDILFRSIIHYIILRIKYSYLSFIFKPNPRIYLDFTSFSINILYLLWDLVQDMTLHVVILYPEPPLIYYSFSVSHHFPSP